MKIIELNHINKIYGSGDATVHVLKDVSLSIEAGDFVAIMGQSGSGKSTLMNILGCLDTATSGDYKIAGESVEGMDADALANLRSRYFGFIFQRYNLLSTLTAAENVELPAVFCWVDIEKRQNRAQQLLNSFKSEDRLKHKPPDTSS